MTHQFKKRSKVLVFLVVLLLISSCNIGKAGDPTATIAAPTLPPAQPTIVMVDGTPQVIMPEQNPVPTANFGEYNPVQMVDIEFFQEETRVIVAAKAQNTRDDAIAKDIHFELLARDEDGNRLHQENLFLKYIFPLETTGLTTSFELMPGFRVEKVELRISSGFMDTKLRYTQPLHISLPGLQKTEDTSAFTAWLENKDPYTYTQVKLNAIAYNKQGQIIGGGAGIVDFVPHKERIGVNIPVDVLDEPYVDRIEVYPWLTQYSASLEAGRWWKTVEVGDWNFEVNSDLQFSGGALLKNKSKALVTKTFYLLTASDENGHVVLAEKGYIDYLWPEEEILFSPGVLDIPFTEQFPDDFFKTPEPDQTDPTKEGDESDTNGSSLPNPSSGFANDLRNTPSARGRGVLARMHLQETYPIETPKPDPTETEAPKPTETPVPAEPTPTKEGGTPIPDEPEKTPKPTLDPSPAGVERVYPRNLTVDFIIVPGEFGQALVASNPLRASQAVFEEEKLAKLSVINNLNIDLNHAIVYVLVYNNEGQIVGGGKQLAQNIVASTATEVTVPIAYPGDWKELTLKAFVTLPSDALSTP